jgi:hypothetical protein
MEFINPSFFWGLSALSIPIAIHFWNKKKSSLLNWAAFKWLIEENQKTAKGISLDKILLLTLRLIAITLLVFLLSSPLFPNKNKRDKELIHIVDPNKKVTDNFRFELENALKNKEKIVALNALSNLKNSLEFQYADVNPLLIQTQLNQVPELFPNQELRIYLANNEKYTSQSSIFIPAKFVIKSILDSSKSIKNTIKGINNLSLFTNDQNQFQFDQNSNLKRKIVKNSPIQILICSNIETEKKSIEASLASLSEIYNFDIDFKSSQEEYDVLIGNLAIKNAKRLKKDGLIIHSSSFLDDTFDSNLKIVSFHEVLSPDSSNLVYNGKLPEAIGNLIVAHYGLQNTQELLSENEFKALFKEKSIIKKNKKDWKQKFLLSLFIISVIVERWLSFKLNA